VKEHDETADQSAGERATLKTAAVICDTLAWDLNLLVLIV